MTLIDWAEKYRVKGTRGRQGTEDLILGKYGEIADDYGDGQLRLRLLAVPRERDMNKALASRKRDAQSGGLKPVHVTEHVYESVWAFDPEDDAASRLAIELVALKRRRALTPERRAALAVQLAAVRAAQAVSNTAQQAA